MDLTDFPKELRPRKNEEIAEKALLEAASLTPQAGKRFTRASTSAVRASISLRGRATPKTASQQREKAPSISSRSTRASSSSSTFVECAMSSQRIRAPRGGARGSGHDTSEETAIWREIMSDKEKLAEEEIKSKSLIQDVFELEKRLKAATESGKKLTIEQIDELSDLYRAGVKSAEESKSILGVEGINGTLNQISILKALLKANDTEETSSTARGSNSRDSHSRSGMDFDGPSDSPGPTTAENRQRKLGSGRTSSLPPRNLDVIIPSRPDGPSSVETNERNSSRPKIVYAVDDEVAFKRKTGEEHDWIQGIVTRVIGEGKSRRYEVRDPFPDPNLNSETLYKSSASQMVPIPAADQDFEDYEIGKRVLALYPTTSTFYKADVKAMVEEGTKVEVLFEEEQEGRIVERRFVLDHKG